MKIVIFEKSDAEQAKVFNRAKKEIKEIEKTKNYSRSRLTNLVNDIYGLNKKIKDVEGCKTCLLKYRTRIENAIAEYDKIQAERPEKVVSKSDEPKEVDKEKKEK